MMPLGKAPVEEELWLNEVVSKDTDSDGNTLLRTKWVKAKKNYSLGSVKNPSKKEILGFRYIPAPPKLFDGSFFGQ